MDEKTKEIRKQIIGMGLIRYLAADKGNDIHLRYEKTNELPPSAK